jgi:hypothetical protein
LNFKRFLTGFKPDISIPTFYWEGEGEGKVEREAGRDK